MRTGWDVHFRELALTRIPVKITTPSQHFKLLNIFPDTAAFGKPSNAVFLAGKRNKLFWFRLRPSGKNVLSCTLPAGDLIIGDTSRLELTGGGFGGVSFV